MRIRQWMRAAWQLLRPSKKQASEPRSLVPREDGRSDAPAQIQNLKVDPVKPAPNANLSPARSSSGRIDTTELESQRSLQFRRASTGNPLDVVVGFDFGTSSSKVVIRTPHVPGRRALAVPFEELGHPQCTYLLPTALFRGADGILSLVGENGAALFRDLKVWMMDHPGDDAVIALAASYVALAIRRARRWFLDSQSEHYGRFDLRWAMNVGIPSAGYDDDSVRQCFMAAAVAAWHLSLGNEPIHEDRARSVAKAALRPEFDPGVPIGVIPEVAAEVVGYARSPLRQPGLHILVDVGASTLDICGFILHEAGGEDRYELPTALVERLGVLALHQRRLEALAAEPPSDSLMGLNPADPFASIPTSATAYARSGSMRLKDLAAADKEHIGACRRALMATVLALKQRRDPNSSRWQHGLPVFLCGGGSRLETFVDVVNQADSSMRTNCIGAGIEVKRLPRLSDLATADLPEEFSDRLAVAYGLSFDELDIGQINPPSSIPDIAQREARDREVVFVSKDQV